ncbi:hypothetical protein ACIRL0_00550 [Streptomyces sp. NPDC102365]|uniref:hypothetical protein n=1 Tax=Streptomyces sp. NPDC102365 TaxID=3366162 RepID=UPI0037FCF836
MTGAERRALLGDKVIEQIHERVAQTPETVSEELIDTLRRILAGPTARVLARKASASPPAPAVSA